MNVGVILDEFSSLALNYEWNSIVLKRETWRQQLTSQKIDFIFVESAWSGNSGNWKYQLTGTSGPKSDFLEMIRWCRAQQIKTVIWNKEDPPHYEDFLPAAREFDFVFTSDSNMIPRYVEDLGHQRVFPFSFAAQPRVHNPVRPSTGWHEREVAFAGMYFAHKFPERREQMDMLLQGAVSALKGQKADLEIFARSAGKDQRYRFPDGLSEHVVGSLPYVQMLTAYKAYKLFLNVNSVVDSPSMCARRVFEINASGTTVLSAPSAAISLLFNQDEVPTVSSKDSAVVMTKALLESPELSERMVHKTQRKIWDRHTYAHRVESVIEQVLPDKVLPVRLPSISVLASTVRPNQVEQLMRTVAEQDGVSVQLILMTHGFELGRGEFDRLSRLYGLKNGILLNASRLVSLGQCLNECVAVADGDVLAKMDDDDFYGKNYLKDQVNALMFSQADVVGKQAHYMYLEDRNATILRYAGLEHRFTDFVMGPTLTARREAFVQFPFRDLAAGEDTRFLSDARSGGASVYSADRFNFFQQRGSQNHTWQISSNELLASGRVVLFGRPDQHVTV
ncbi:glycosyltransferase [Arthrobacter sp. Bz4]|uniref:glycosyltransferase family protein n=1 Tax=Arthrobacter sp. Bz4 TaxID=2171979 RepID=UPI00325F9CA2